MQAVAGALAIASLLAARSARAQTAADGGRLEVAIGAARIGSLDFGSTTATETTATLSQTPIFTSATTLGAASVVEARVGWRWTRAFTVEAEASFGRPVLRIDVANDIELAPSTTASEKMEQFTIGGAVLWHLPVGGRAVPFAAAGGGYLRTLHENATLVQTGHYYQFGGGVDVLLASRPQAKLSVLGVRAEARAIVRVKGAAFDDNARTAPAAGASLFLRF
jgi:outer membrane protein with beta-barrel domain